LVPYCPATQQGESTGPPVTAATSIAEIPAPHVSGKRDETKSAEPLANGGVGGAVPDPSAPQEKAEPTSADKPAESGEPTAEPTALPASPAAADSQQTNGAAKPAVAEPVAAAAAEVATTEEKSTAEPAPATTATPGTNGEAKPVEEADMEASAPTAGTTATDEDSAAGIVGGSNKRSAETALGADADAEGDAAGGKRLKGDVDVDTAAATTAEIAPAAKTEAKAPAAETNGGGAEPADAAPPAPPAPAKKGGRPRKQPGKAAAKKAAAAAAAAVGRTARKTRSQGPVEL
jgi:hypothetical protein